MVRFGILTNSKKNIRLLLIIGENMKKKYVLIGLIIVLLFPILNVYYDGGTKTLTSLLFKVIVWNKIDGEVEGGRKIGTDVYWFPNNFGSLNSYYVTVGDYTSLYEKLIDEIYNESPSLNSNAEYIALDLDSFDLIYDERKVSLMEYTRKYNENIKDSTFEELKEEENILDTGGIKGILISVKDVKAKKTTVTLTINKYKASLGSVSVKYKATLKNNKWELKQLEYGIS